MEATCCQSPNKKKSPGDVHSLKKLTWGIPPKRGSAFVHAIPWLCYSSLPLNDINWIHVMLTKLYNLPYILYPKRSWQNNTGLLTIIMIPLSTLVLQSLHEHEQLLQWRHLGEGSSSYLKSTRKSQVISCASTSIWASRKSHLIKQIYFIHLIIQDQYILKSSIWASRN